MKKIKTTLEDKVRRGEFTKEMIAADIETIKLKRRQGLFQIVARKTGVSLPTVRKYLVDGNIVSPKAKAVIEIALREVSND